MINQISSQVNKGLGQIRQAFLGLVARGGSKVLQLKGLAGETLQEVEIFQHVGFSSDIPVDARVALLPMQGKTSKSIVIATTGGEIVISVATGETCIYDQFGHSVWLKADGTHISGDLFVDGAVQATGDISDQKGSIQQIRTIFNVHENGSNGLSSEQM